MKAPPSVKKAPLFWLFGFLILYSALVVPLIFIESPTNDEPVEITNGYFYWQGDVVSHNHHPPLPKLLQALPSRFLNLNDQVRPYSGDYLARADQFLFNLNRSRFELMTSLARFVTLLMGLGIGVLLFLGTRSRPRSVLLTAMALWVFEPNLSSFSGLAVADLPVAFFFLASVFVFQKYLEKPGFHRAIGAGLLAGMAVTCKFSALVLIPIFIFLEWKAVPTAGKKKIGRWNGWIAGAAAFFGWIFLLYLPGTLLEPQHRNPFAYFLLGLQAMADYGRFNHHPTYFWGIASRQNHWLYYPAAFVLKSTLPFLILMGGAAILALRKTLSIPAWIWVPPLGIFLSILPVQNLGVRYLLPAYPFLILMAAWGAEAFRSWKKPGIPRLGKILLVGLLAWHTGSFLSAGTDRLSYFNDLVGKDRKLFFLGDSNLDWGQDVKRLAETARQRGWGRVKLACSSGVDPSLYGLAWEPWTEKDESGPQPGWVYAVNASLLQLGPVFYPNLISITNGWVTVLPPSGKVGDSWYYFEMPGDRTRDPTGVVPHAQGFRRDTAKTNERMP